MFVGRNPQCKVREKTFRQFRRKGNRGSGGSHSRIDWGALPGRVAIQDIERRLTGCSREPYRDMVALMTRCGQPRDGHLPPARANSGGDQSLGAGSVGGEHPMQANPQQGRGIATAPLQHFPPGAVGLRGHIEAFGAELPRAHQDEKPGHVATRQSPPRTISNPPMAALRVGNGTPKTPKPAAS